MSLYFTVALNVLRIFIATSFNPYFLLKQENIKSKGTQDNFFQREYFHAHNYAKLATARNRIFILENLRSPTLCRCAIHTEQYPN